MKKFFLLILFFSTLKVHAGGTFNLKGKIHGFTPETVKINDGHLIFDIDRKLIHPQQQQSVKSAKIGSEIQVMIPFNAVKAVRSPAGKK